MARIIAAIIAVLMTVSCGGAFPGYRNPVPAQWEDQFLYWCKRDGYWPVYLSRPSAASCPESHVSRGEWDRSRLPLVVNAEPSLVPETLDAVDAINDLLGFKLFRFVHSNMDPDIGVMVAGEHFFAAAEAKRLTVDGKHYGLVKVYNGFEKRDRADIMAHELLHLVGLRHDSSKLSIMYSSSAARVATIEKRDIAALRSIYL